MLDIRKTSTRIFKKSAKTFFYTIYTTFKKKVLPTLSKIT